MPTIVASLLHPFHRPLRLGKQEERERARVFFLTSGEGEEISSGYTSGLRTCWVNTSRELRTQNQLSKLRNVCSLVLTYLINPLCALNLPHFTDSSGVAENCSQAFSRTGPGAWPRALHNSSRDDSDECDRRVIGPGGFRVRAAALLQNLRIPLMVPRPLDEPEDKNEWAS